jgi:O-antigen biosynthesis protein WbqP
MNRAFDFLISLLLLVVFSPVLAFVALLISLTSSGGVIFKSKRVGYQNRIFPMWKFRTMRIDTPQLATHLLEKPQNFLTPIGAFLRRTSLDELPQLWNVLRGDMALVGPRPALFNQEDLISLRSERGVHLLRPGITGWAQINGRDELPIPLKVELDAFYLQNRSLIFDIKILLMTLFKVFKSEGVSH